MSSAARIEELQKKFDENPRRYFAPLANECRKAGDLDAAIAICRAHLPQQPGHMSGHIVYGQALFEAGEMDEARTVFETALGLDPENLIALRHLGDIAARHGDRIGARQWYVRVLEADPRNEEIQALVATIDDATASGDLLNGPIANRPPSDVTRADPTSGDPAWSPSDENISADEGRRDRGVMPLSEPSGTAAPEGVAAGALPEMIDPELLAVAAEAAPADALPHDGASSDWGAEPAALDGLEPTSFASAGDQAAETEQTGVEPLDFEPTGVGSSAARPAAPDPAKADAAGAGPNASEANADAAGVDADVPAAGPDGFELTTFEAAAFESTTLETPRGGEVPWPVEEATPAAQSPRADDLAFEPIELEPTDFDASSLATPPSPEPPQLGVRDGDREPEPDAVPGPDAFVTETMAELYLRQGYRERALETYRLLVARQPADGALRARLAAVEASAGADDDRVAAEGEPSATADEAYDTSALVAGPSSGRDAVAVDTLHSAAAADREPGLPAEMDPELIDAAADAGEGDADGSLAAGSVPSAEPSADVATSSAPRSGGVRTGPTIREFLAAVAAARPAPAEATRGAAVHGAGATAAAAALGDAVVSHEAAAPHQDTALIDEPALLDDVETPAVGGEIAEVVELPDAVEAADAAGAVPSAGAPTPPSLDAIFGETVTPSDEAAADRLADAFQSHGSPTARGGDAADPLRGRPARPAGSDLSLDHVFGQQRPGDAGRQTGSFSFDQFFAEGAVRPPQDVAPEQAPTTDTDDDIEQFNSWLKGLKPQ